MKLLFLSLVKIDSLEERYIYQDLLREFAKRGHSVTVVCAVERRTGLPTRIIKEPGVTILQVRTPNMQKAAVWEKVLGMTMMNVLFKRQIKKHFADASFDLIVYATPPVTLAGLVSWLKRRYQATTYLLLKDIFPQNAVDMGYFRADSFIHRHYSRLEKRLYRLSDRIGCMSPANTTYVACHHPELSGRVELNPNSLDVSRIPEHPACDQSILETYGISKKAVVFLFGGNLGKPQGVEFLLHLIEAAAASSPTAFFLIVGDGTEYDRMRVWFARKRPTNAKLVHRLPKEQFDRLAACCHVGLIMLRREFTIPNFPSRLLTYLERHMPVLALTDAVSDIGSIAEHNDFGRSSEHGDLSHALEHIEFFVVNEHERKRMGKNGFEFLIREYDTALGYQKIIDAMTPIPLEKGNEPATTPLKRIAADMNT